MGKINLFDFCLRGEARQFHFNPYFTCLIGGRGTGKSTLLNLIAKVSGFKTDFFDKNTLDMLQRLNFGI